MFAPSPIFSLLMPLLISTDLFTWSWLMGIAGPVLVTQAIAGIFGLIGLIFVTRRFLTIDFPAAMSGVNRRLDEHTKIFERLDLDIRKLVIDFTLLNERHTSLRGRVDRLEEREERLDLDDTRARRRTTRRETNGE